MNLTWCFYILYINTVFINNILKVFISYFVNKLKSKNISDRKDKFEFKIESTVNLYGMTINMLTFL